MKKLILSLLLVMSFSASADGGIVDTIREVFNLPEVVSSTSYEMRSERTFRTGTTVDFYGNRVRLRGPGHHKMRPIGKCIVIGKNTYDDGSVKYFHRGRCRS